MIFIFTFIGAYVAYSKSSNVYIYSISIFLYKLRGVGAVNENKIVFNNFFQIQGSRYDFGEP